MKNLKKLNRNALKEISGGYRNPNNPQVYNCYQTLYCYSDPNVTLGSTGIPVNQTTYDYGSIPTGATSIRMCGYSAIMPPPAGCNPIEF